MIRNEKLEKREALEQALYLALIAPSDEKAGEASDLAEKLAAGLDPVTVERAKVNALERAEEFSATDNPSPA